MFRSKLTKRLAVGAAALAAGVAGILAINGSAQGGPDVAISEDAARDSVRSFLGKSMTLKSMGVTEGSPNPTWSFIGDGGYAFSVDGVTGEVVLAHFPLPTEGPGVSVDVAREAARALASKAYKGFASFRLSEDGEYVDHGDEAAPTYTFTWREYLGEVRGPSLVSVVVNGSTGEVSSYRARRVPVTVARLTPVVTHDEAISRAVEAAGYSPDTKTAELEVWLRPETQLQHLVWRVRVNGLKPALPDVPAGTLGLPGNYELILDAVTGEQLSLMSG